MSLPRKPRSVAARMSLALSASLVLAACSGGQDEIVDAGAQVEPTSTEAPTTTETSTTEPNQEEEAPTTVTSTTATSTTVASTAEAPTTEAPTTAAPVVESQIPDIAVTNVSTGESVSLQAVAGTGTPVALWFWYPH